LREGQQREVCVAVATLSALGTANRPRRSACQYTCTSSADCDVTDIGELEVSYDGDQSNSRSGVYCPVNDRSNAIKFDRKGVRTMKKLLAMLIVGATIALPAAGAFAGEDTHPDRPNMWQTPGVVLQTEPATPAAPGTLAGPGQAPTDLGPYHELRLENIGQ
jgi:hypothetical protein